MDFFSVILFLITYHLRPQDWVGFLLESSIVQYIMILALVSMLYRHKGLNFGDIFKTPHDWMILFFFLWVVITAPASNRSRAFEDLRNLSLFYVVIVQALYNRKRLNVFVRWWAWMIFAVAAFAVASEFGFDPMNSYDLTHGFSMRGRLCLNISIYDNPNALAHAVIACIPMLYYLYIWNRPVFLKEIYALTLAVPIWCAYLTQSRGGYMAGVSATSISMLFGRPKMIQLIVFVSIIVLLPPMMRQFRHMQRADDSGTEASVQGRKEAFLFGLSIIKQRPFSGLGYQQWGKYSPWKYTIKRGRKIKTQRIAPHSAYVGIGGEQGRVGLFLWLGVFYCSLRTLLMSRCKDWEDERIRRVLLSAVVAYLVSSWSVDIEYRATYFILAGAIAAFHRVVRLEVPEPAPVNPSPASAPTPKLESDSSNSHLSETVTPTITPPGRQKPKIWNRISWLDIGGMLAYTWLTVILWEYIANTM